jgi:predicted ATP-grasp superfamily ATP-dependent carboligase
VAAAGSAKLLGVTEQLVGAAWCGARGFQYCGSLGPLRLSSATMQRFRRLGDCLASEFQLAGLFGVDAILNRRGIWPVEVNPRYTASIEVLERALGIHAVRDHVEACSGGVLPGLPATPAPPAEWCGKAILFAQHGVEIDDRRSRLVERANDLGRIGNPSYAEAWPSLADIPPIGSRIAPHRPIMTLLAAGRNRKDVLVQLPRSALDRTARVEPFCPPVYDSRRSEFRA